MLLQEKNNFDEINNFFMSKYQNKNRDLREAQMKSLHEMEDLKRFLGSTFDEFSRRRLIDNQDTILELTARIHELQNEENCLKDSRDFKYAESVRSRLFHVPSQPALLPPFSRSWRDAKLFCGNAEPQRQKARHLGHAWYVGTRFCESTGIFFITLSARVESVDFGYVKTHITARNE